MGDFFRSVKFKILVAILCVLVVLMFVGAYLGGRASPTSQFLGLITTPIQKLSSTISGAATGFFEKYVDAQSLYEENQQLKEEIRRLREQVVDIERYKQENDHYKQYLDLKEQNPTLTFEPAEVIGRDPNERFYAFSIDKGSLDGVSPNDPVITPDGLVGRVSEVGLSYAKVTTILDVANDIGATDSRTRDIGVVSGDVALSAEGLCKMSYLERESAAAPGDLVLTSGLGGVYPKGLVIGTMKEVRTEAAGMTLYAVITPAAQVQNIKDVFIITSFSGQGGGPKPAQGAQRSGVPATLGGDASSSAPPASSEGTPSREDASSEGQP
ncbi:rod shape-determining protein MreC [Harryflintia acetispora]|uniref:rod shape-determining protein MreC n=1 Tax=Harryflintia acetispora TaxID=1849041 RepID=UPI00189B2708|nr:rod shape-determining protein MreC [Harryflintia acetispora]